MSQHRRAGAPRAHRARAAAQVHADFAHIGQAASLATACLYGGSPYGPQEGALRRGLDVVVGTPGRVKDHLERGGLRLHKLQCAPLPRCNPTPRPAKGHLAAPRAPGGCRVRQGGDRRAARPRRGPPKARQPAVAQAARTSRAWAARTLSVALMACGGTGTEAVSLRCAQVPGPGRVRRDAQHGLCGRRREGAQAIHSCRCRQWLRRITGLHVTLHVYAVLGVLGCAARRAALQTWV